MTLDPRNFRKALACFASGVTVMTSLIPDSRQPVGVTVSAFSSLSLDPPLVLFCLGNRTVSLPAFRDFGTFGVNVLSEHQRDLSMRFASRVEDKWLGVAWAAGETGVPLLGGCLANLECVVDRIVDGGDHQIFIGRALHMKHQEGGSPLVYFRGSYLDPGPPLALTDLI